MVEDLVNHKRYRVDHLIQDSLPKGSTVVVEDMNFEEMGNFIKDKKIKSPDGNDLSEPKTFNLLLKLQSGK